MRLKELREKKGYTQKQLGKILHVEQNTISQWETGERQLRADKLFKLSKILGCTVDELLNEEVG